MPQSTVIVLLDPVREGEQMMLTKLEKLDFTSVSLPPVQQPIMNKMIILVILLDTVIMTVIRKD